MFSSSLTPHGRTSPASVPALCGPGRKLRRPWVSAVGAILAILLLLLPHAGSAQSLGGGLASPPLTQDHWSYDLLEALDAAGLGWGWMTSARPSDSQVLRRELLRIRESQRGTSENRRLVESWLSRLGGEVGVWGEGGVRDGQGWVDPGGGGYARLHGSLWGPGGISVWGSWDSGSRQAFDGLMEGGISIPAGPFSVVAGRIPVKSGVPASTSVQFDGATPTDGIFLLSRRPVEWPGLGWLLGASTWQFGLAPWFGIDAMEEGWVGLASGTFQPHARFRLGLSRTARFGGVDNAGVTLPRLLRTAFFQSNEPYWWDDHKIEISGRYAWHLGNQPLTTYLVLAQEDSPLWKDPAIAVGLTAPLLQSWGLLHLGYQYTAYGQRARWCPGCEYARGRQDNRFQGEWYIHGQHGSHERRGVPVGNPLGGYGADHTVTARFWDASGRSRGEIQLFSRRREAGNMLLERWPGKRHGLQIEVAREVHPGMELSIQGLVAGGPSIPRETGLWVAGRVHLPALQRPSFRSSGGVEEWPLEPVALPALPSGQRVRVRSPSFLHQEAKGTVVRGNTGGLTLALSDGQVVHLEPGEVGGVDVATRGKATWRGAFLGGVLGLIVGEALPAAARANDMIDPSCGELDCYPGGFAQGVTLAGAGLGALLGSLVEITVWRPATTPQAIGLSLSTPPLGGAWTPWP